MHEHRLPNGITVALVEMPGFNNTEKSDAEVLLDISQLLQSTYQRDILSSGFIYLHRIGDARIVTNAARYLRMFQKLCGSQAPNKVVIATTF